MKKAIYFLCIILQISLYASEGQRTITELYKAARTSMRCLSPKGITPSGARVTLNGEGSFIIHD